MTTPSLFDLPAVKQVADTSIQAYREIAPELPARERLVLDALREYWELNREGPTAYELFRFMVGRRTATRDLNEVRPRLTELLARKLVQRGPEKRACRVTGRTAYAWTLNKEG